MITLAKSFFWIKRLARLAVDKSLICDRWDTLHDGISQMLRESRWGEECMDQRPLYSIICFGHSKLQPIIPFSVSSFSLTNGNIPWRLIRPLSVMRWPWTKLLCSSSIISGRITLTRFAIVLVTIFVTPSRGWLPLNLWESLELGKAICYKKTRCNNSWLWTNKKKMFLSLSLSLLIPFSLKLFKITC